jgi:hypothetical protein
VCGWVCVRSWQRWFGVAIQDRHKHTHTRTHTHMHTPVQRLDVQTGVVVGLEDDGRREARQPRAQPDAARRDEVEERPLGAGAGAGGSRCAGSGAVEALHCCEARGRGRVGRGELIAGGAKLQAGIVGHQLQHLWRVARGVLVCVQERHVKSKSGWHA